jgi:hypothetical protein
MGASLATRLTRTERRLTARRQDRAQRAKLVYVDPVFFARHRLGFAPDEWQARVLSWTGNRLLLNCSRQSGKSTVAAILGLHRALFSPGSLILLVSPSLRQSGELFRKVRDFLGMLPLRPALIEDNRLSLQLQNRSRVISLPSKEGNVRGFSSVSLLIFDEASRVTDDLFLACKPMLAVSGGQLIAMSTPWGRRGFFFQEWSEGQGWERVEIPATRCPRISKEFLEAERRTMPKPWFDSEYSCVFGDTVDSVFSQAAIAAAMSDDVQPLFPTEVLH